MTQKVFEAVTEIHQKGTAVLIAEQNIADVLEIADRAYVMEQGMIRLKGSAREMRESEEIKTMYLGL